MNLALFSCLLMLRRKDRYYEDIDDLSGLSKNHPLLSLCLLLILFSLAGIPPLAGFFAKFYVFKAVLEQSMYFLAIVGLLTTVISAFYYLRIIKIIYFDEKSNTFDEVKNKLVQATIFLSCGILISFFLYPSFLNNVVNSLFIV